MGGSLQPVTLRRCIRTNTKKISSNELQKRLEKRGVRLHPISFVHDGFIIENSRFNLVSTPEYLLGLFYIQDAAAQTPVEVLQPQGVVLDAFAAPGGKTIQLAQYADVIAIEQDKKRFNKLIHNLERLGIENCIAYQMDFLAVKKQFYYILVDAPCSGNYMLEKTWIQKNSLQRIQERAEKQKQYLAHAITLLSSNGVLVYSTCSLEPEENEQVIQYALDHFPVRIEKINLIGDSGLTRFHDQQFHSDMRYCRRFWPQKTNTIGFFVARLRKC